MVHGKKRYSWLNHEISNILPYGIRIVLIWKTGVITFTQDILMFPLEMGMYFHDTILLSN